MKSNIRKCVASVALAMGMSLTMQAASITGGISLAGGPIGVNSGDLATGTAVTSFGVVHVSNVNGDFTPAVAGTLVTTTTGFTFLPGLSPSPALNVWSFAVGGNTYSFDLGVINNVSQGVMANGTHFLNISGSGTLHITGFTDTPGSYIFTANSAAETFSFSSSNGAQPPSVPDGGTTAILMGVALSGLALLRRKLA